MEDEDINNANQEVKKDPRRYHNPALAPTAEEVEQVAEADSLEVEIDEALLGERKQAAAKKINTAKSGSDQATE